MPNSLKFLIIDTYYPKFLASVYSANPELTTKGYGGQIDFLMKQCFGTADFYSRNLKKLGCAAEEIIPNNEILQRQWAVENDCRLSEPFYAKVVERFSLLKRLLKSPSWLLYILEQQIAKSRPDVLYLQDLSFCPPDFLQKMKKYARMIVGQIACPLPPLPYLKPYDLILTSFPHYVGRFRNRGIRAEYLKIAFDPSVLDEAGALERRYTCTFVGGISRAHKTGTLLLEELARRVDIDFFGYGAEELEKSSPILPRHYGEVWGLNMYRSLLSSKITINRHIDVAENFANNMRLYEATGCGALLITDFKDNLNELFEEDKEVVAYKTVDDLVRLIQYYVEHDEQRETIANAGQQRTLREHTYFNRMQSLVDIINMYI